MACSKCGGTNHNKRTCGRSDSFKPIPTNMTKRETQLVGATSPKGAFDNNNSNLTESYERFQGKKENETKGSKFGKVVISKDSTITGSPVILGESVFSSKTDKKETIIKKSKIRGNPNIIESRVEQSMISSQGGMVEKSQLNNVKIYGEVEIFNTVAQDSTFSDKCKVVNSNIPTLDFMKYEPNRIENSDISGKSLVLRQSVVSGSRIEDEAFVSTSTIKNSTISDQARISGHYDPADPNLRCVVLDSIVRGNAEVKYGATIVDCELSGNTVVDSDQGVVEGVTMNRGYIADGADVHKQGDVQILQHEGVVYTRYRGSRKLFSGIDITRPWVYTSQTFDAQTGGYIEHPYYEQATATSNASWSRNHPKWLEKQDWK